MSRNRLLHRLSTYLWLHQILLCSRERRVATIFEEREEKGKLPVDLERTTCCLFASGRPSLSAWGRVLTSAGTISGCVWENALHQGPLLLIWSGWDTCLAAAAHRYPIHPVSGNTRHKDVNSIFTKNVGDGSVMSWPEFVALFSNL